jgi:hypothetical protein
MNISRKAIENLAAHLKLPLPGPFDQDWEFMVSDPKKIKELIHAYESYDLDNQDKHLLLHIVIDSYNNCMYNNSGDLADWDKICNFMINDIDNNLDILYYWSDIDQDDVDNCFPVTPLVRKVLESIVNDNKNP